MFGMDCPSTASRTGQRFFVVSVPLQLLAMTGFGGCEQIAASSFVGLAMTT